MDEESNANVPGTQENESNDSSLTLSLTPPVCDDDPVKDETSTIISEHLSVENDRSMQEIEVNFPENFVLDLSQQHMSQEPNPHSLNNSSFNNTSSIISLNGLDKFIENNMEVKNNVNSILEDILSNDQFKSDNGAESKEESLDIFANVDLDDKILNSYNLGKCDFNISNNSINNNSYDEVCKRVHDFEELIAIKDTAIAQLTTELDSYRELTSYPSSNSLGTSTTEYKQYQEESHKLVEYHNAMAHKDDQIEKLTQSLQQSILNREEMKQHFKNELSQLQEELRKTSDLLKIQRDDVLSSPKRVSDSCFSKIIEILGPENAELIEIFRKSIQRENDEKNRILIEEIGTLKNKIETDRIEFEEEMSRLKNLLAKDVSSEVLEAKQELDAKHSKEMEELRTYFEKKCSELEKNYSEEVFSQQSRKVSGSSSCSEAELSSDFVFNQPGPGGDTFKSTYTKKDLIRLQKDLSQLVSLLDSHNLSELSDDDFEKLKNEIHKTDLKNIFKFDLTLLRAEFKAKYQTELENLREDFDNRIELMNLENEKKLESLHGEIDDLNRQLQGRISTVTAQEVANSGEFEIDEVVQSYERRLQEQVTLAKIDIIAALEAQIQRLVSMEDLDEDWPHELLQLKARFTQKYEADIENLKILHQQQIELLKEEHVKHLNGALERARRRSLTRSDSVNKSELDLAKERDNFKRQAVGLRNLLGELLKYFTQCEDELNNTLVEELVSKNILNNDDEEHSQRVHLTPNFTELIDLIDNDNNELDSIDLKSELGGCLEKLKADANAILALTSNVQREERSSVGSGKSVEAELSSLTRKLISETQIKNDLAERLKEAENVVQSLEIDRNTLENQLEQVVERQKIVEKELARAKEKIAELIENGHREIVSEGYGEEGHQSARGMDEAVATLGLLQERARLILEKPRNLDQSLLNLVEDLTRAAEKIIEEARKDHEDMKQQIEAADKKYKITCQFLEDQAAEREQERDESQKEIDKLKERLKDRDKDRASCERISNEVENLELQLRDVSKQLESAEKRCSEVESEKQEAVDKIYELRDIIRDLEDQIKSRTRTEDELKSIIEELEVYVRQQVKTSPETGGENRNSPRNQIAELHKYISNLETEVQQLRLSTEIAGSEGALQQVKNHLCEFETTLDKRTRELEGLHSTLSTTTCSSPSEDMSIRDVVNRPAPSSVFEDCEVPLQQLSRLKEKLIRHSRAEDAALKRIRDLEMETVAVKDDLEECQTERDILKKQISDHLVLISNLQIRLDEQRIRAEHIEKQTNTSLEVQNYDLKNALTSLEEKLTKKDKAIAQLKSDILETKKHLDRREKELNSLTNQEAKLVSEMQEQLECCRSENFKLKTSLNETNCDIKKRLVQTEKELEAYTSLNLDRNDVETLNKIRLTGLSFQDLFNFTEMEQMRRASSRNDDYSVSQSNAPDHNKRASNETVLLGVEPEISCIEKVGASNLFYSLQAPLAKTSSSEKHVRFEDEVEKDKVIQDLQEQNRELLEKLTLLQELEVKLESLQQNLEETENNLEQATVTFQEEQKKSAEVEQQLRDELASRTRELREKQDELVEKLAKQQFLEIELENAEEARKELKNLLNSRDKEIAKLEKLHAESEVKISQQHSCEVSKLNSHISELNKELAHLQHLITEKDKIITQMSEDSRSLHINLETIQSKLQETGNIVDLGRRLRDEQKKNSELTEELHSLKAQLLSLDKKSIDDVTGQIQRELEYSAQLDSSLFNAIDSSLEADGESLKLALRKQKSVNKHLMKAKECVEKRCEEMECKLEIILKRNESLKIELEKGKSQLSATQLEDAKLIEQLRIKLNAALDNEVEFEKLLKKEKSNRAQLENELKSMKAKVASLTSAGSKPEASEAHQKEVVALKEEVDKLLEREYTYLDEIKALRKLRDKLEKELNLVKPALEVKLGEVDKLEAKIQRMQSDEEKLKKGRKPAMDPQLNEVNKLEKKVQQMQSNEKMLKDQLELYKLSVMNKAALLEENERDRKILKKENDLLNQKLKRSGEELLPDKLMEKIKDLRAAVKDNMRLVELITRLKDEKTVLEDRIVALESKNNAPLPFDDPVSRANYLFAKYLRSESYRKALQWQKRYLTRLLATYQSEETSIVIERAPRRSSGIDRFKRIALAVMAIQRMKYMVRRWHSGIRIAEQRSAANSGQRAQFQVGQPVSSQVFTRIESNLAESEGNLPWCGNSPPSKDKVNKTKVISVPLTSPGLLHKYIDQFNQIQDKLGLND